MFSRLTVLFVVVPALELYLLIRLGTLIGAPETLGFILLTGVVGSYLAKSQGLSIFRRFQEKLSSGALPGKELLDGVIILVSGALLITPGLLTDVVGLLGLIPVTRRAIRSYLYKKLLPSLAVRGFQFSSGGMTGGAAARPTESNAGPNNGYATRRSFSDDAETTDSSPVTIGGTAKRRPSGRNSASQ